MANVMSPGFVPERNRRGLGAGNGMVADQRINVNNPAAESAAAVEPRVLLSACR
jgi:hypothetical protein